MSFRLTHIHDYHRFIAIDFGIYRVRSSIYDLSEGSLACTGFAGVRQSRKNFSQGMIVDIGGVSQILEQAILQSGNHLESIPEDIIMSFPSQSFVSDVLTTQYSRDDHESVLTMQEIDSMIKKIENTSYERAKNKSQKQFGIISDDLKLISSTIVSIQIDGRSVSSPIGFSGSRVRLTVLNIFVPSGEFNIMRSVVSRIDKQVISLIPQPLILPKLIENTEAISSTVCLIDIGYGHTTITLISNNEILGFETFPYGTEMFMSIIADSHKDYSLLQIENIICSASDLESGVHRQYLDEFLDYVHDAIFGYLQSEDINMTFKYLYMHGNIFENTLIYQEFSKRMEASLGYEIKKNKLYEALDVKIPSDHCTNYGLSLMAKELLFVKKDPLVRILRYVLYQYE